MHWAEYVQGKGPMTKPPTFYWGCNADAVGADREGSESDHGRGKSHSLLSVLSMRPTSL